MSIQSQLSHLMPVAKAVSDLGEEKVTCIVQRLLKLQMPEACYDNTETDAGSLVAAMRYTVTNSGSANSPRGDSDIPPPIREAWKKLQSKPLLLDKHTLIQFLVPACAQPHVGPGGHMGLFDCLIYALQVKPSTASSPSNAAVSANPEVAIPDVIIFLAICHNYWDLQNEMSTDEAIMSFSSDHPTIVKMSQWMFIIYDAYQKKGLITRDTIHRFLSDIHGEESFKTPQVRELLDKIFRQSLHLTCRDFLEAISVTLSYSPQPSHLLLDWMCALALGIQPAHPPSESAKEFLETIDRQTRWLPQILDQQHLGENRLYEIKRRFHSLVETSTTVIQGDPMTSDGVVTDNSQSTSAQTPTPLPKRVISSAVFCEAVCHPSTDQGHGGYLPQSLAEQVFRGVFRMTATKESLKELKEPHWDLTHVLQFGGLCVRAPDDESLMRWIIQELLPSSETLGGTRSHPEMTKAHFGELLKIACDHAAFRLQADRFVLEDQDDNDAEANGEDTVSAVAALILGLVPEDSSFGKVISLSVLLDHVLPQLGTDDIISLQKVLDWNQEERKAQKRLNLFIADLRLIASVVFGVPPKLASVERNLIEEIHRRHQLRHPQTTVSRRGPRGTVWFLIDYGWYQSWTKTVENVSFTPEDDEDLRDKYNATSNPRRLPKISNRGLLRDGGSLALRVDIKWRNDYEILPPLAWSALQAWYDGGPPIYRSVVPYSASNNNTTNRGPRSSIRTENEIELYPFFVTMFLCDTASRGEARPFQQGVPVSRVSPVHLLLVQLCKGLDVDPKMGRLWVIESQPTDGAEPLKESGDWLLNLDTNIAQQRKNRVGGDQSGSANINLLLELKDPETGRWPRGEDGRRWIFTKNDTHEMDIGDGVVGLYNMGNTCYMNSPIQCLSHTPIFRDYFTTKCYLKDINTTNPLGYEGRLAQVSAVLINSLWKRFSQQIAHQPKRVTAPGSYAPVSAPALTPKTFKDALGRFNDHFEGNEQHDAQELLGFLLGGLSEDLNRIVDKPYIQAPDSDGRPDSELADIWWSNHLKREMSIIVALFTGQYKSLLKCKTCSYESARFEPFTFLQLPLPEDDTVPVNLILYPAREGMDVMKYSVRVHNNGTLYDVLLSLSKLFHEDQLKIDGVDEKPANPESDEEKQKLNDHYKKRAQNLAVVDMREGYIFKIAPNAWRLPDLQNKDTGELPLLHVYELDPLPDVENNVDEKEDEIPDIPCGFLALAQRKTEKMDKEVLHPLTHRVFGVPVLLRIPCMDEKTGRQVYDLVAQHLMNFVPEAALKFLEPGALEERIKSSDIKEKTEGQSKYEIRQNLTKTMSDAEEVAAGPVPRYGFRLRLTTRDGRRCALCPWYDCCIGCYIPDDDLPTVVMNGDSIAIDWHFAVDVATNGFGTRGYRAENAVAQVGNQRARLPISIKNHSSCGVGLKYGQNGTITLEDCLDAFALEEKIPEAYCSKCKDFRVQTKRMSLWRLPPVVIIQLKRFQFTQHLRRKLRDFVEFPVDGLDLSRIMAKDSESVESVSNGELKMDGAGKEEKKTDDDSSSSHMNDDDGRGEKLYDLYGVVHHQGALSGGHYVASIKSDDGQWRLFNDAQIFEIHSRDVVDSSAYILFYIRRDVKDQKLDDFWNTSPAKDGEGLTEEEMEKLIHGRSDRCVIS